MRSVFLVSTTHHLLAIEPESTTASLVHTGKGLYFGLAADIDGRIYVGCRNAVAGPESAEVRAAERGSILVFDPRLELVGEITAPFALRDVHGIACFDDRLWVTCSFDNFIAVHDLSSGRWTRWYPAPDATEPGCDSHHFNTVKFLDGEVWLVAHRFGPSEMLRFTYPDLQLDSAVSLGVMAHDIFNFGGAPATCSSGEGVLVNTRGERLRTGSFPRGMAEDTRGKLLGLSLNAPRAERHTQSAVLRWFTPEWRFESDYLLPGAGMVLDILALPPGCVHGIQRKERWPAMQVCAGSYNPLAPGNTYDLRSGPHAGAMPGWHAPEATLRWTAARNASVKVLTAPRERKLGLMLASYYAEPYRVDVLADGELLGAIDFTEPGERNVELLLTPGASLERTITFRVPHLWVPPGGNDPRMLGVAVRELSVEF
ncbi:MAG TPA: hypothetical protein VES20_05055 [Bryobacteraceae bacterium]|nr:hypothetical protein [Bryobacteraceae bacterium]